MTAMVNNDISEKIVWIVKIVYIRKITANDEIGGLSI